MPLLVEAALRSGRRGQMGISRYRDGEMARGREEPHDIYVLARNYEIVASRVLLAPSALRTVKFQCCLPCITSSAIHVDVLSVVGVCKPVAEGGWLRRVPPHQMRRLPRRPITLTGGTPIQSSPNPFMTISLRERSRSVTFILLTCRGGSFWRRSCLRTLRRQ